MRSYPELPWQGGAGFELGSSVRTAIGRRLVGFAVALSILLGLSAGRLAACDILFLTKLGNENEYRVDDTAIVKVTILLTHNNCPENIQEVEYECQGLEIIGATKWKAKTPDQYVRLLKCRITGTEDVTLHVRRACEKEGVYGSIQLNVVQE